jgi:S1-C subfamily serine protease
VELPDVIDLVRPAIVQISATVIPGTDEHRAKLGGKRFASRPIGTGFLVDEGAHVVTAQHVVEGARRLAAEWVGSEVSVNVGPALPNTDNMRANFNDVGFEIIDEDLRHDLTLLRMMANPFKGEVPPMIQSGDESFGAMCGVPTLDPERPRDGMLISISGYPLGEPVLVTNTGIVASSWSTVTDQVPHPSIPNWTLPDIRDTYLADVQANPGNSGGPVYASRDGSIVGVLVAGRLRDLLGGGQPVMAGQNPIRTDAGLSVIVPIKYAIGMLDKHGVVWKARQT